MKLKVILVYLYIFSLLSFITMTYAFFRIQTEHKINLSLGDFEVYASVSFNGVYIDENSIYYEKETQTVIVNAHDDTQINYIEYLKIDIIAQPKIVSKMRILIQDEWILTRTFNPDSMYPMDPIVESGYFIEQNETYFPYSYLKKGDLSLFKFNHDGYVYYLNNLLKDVTMSFSIINGGARYPVRSNDIYVETCIVRIGIQVEMVQANRYHEIWGIEENFYTT